VHLNLKCLSLVFLVILAGSECSDAQVSIQHEHPIISLGLDSTDQLFIEDNKGDQYRLGTYELLPVSIKTGEEIQPEFQLWNGQLRKNMGDNYSLYPLPFSPAALYPIGNKVFLAGSDGLWLFQEGQTKKYYVPGVVFPEDLISVKAYDQYIGMISRDRELLIYDTIHQTIKFIDNRVDDFTIDRWHCVFYSRGKTLSNFIDYVNDKTPLISISSIADASGKKLDPPITISPEDAIYVKYRATYSPMMNNIDAEYCINDDSCQVIGNPKLLRIMSLQEGNNVLRIRANGNKYNYATTSPIKVKVTSDSLGRFWPWLFGGLGLLLLLNFFSQRRLKNELKTLEVEKEKINLQLQVAHEQQRLGQLQMNPHFLFNTLNSISGLIALNENKKARTHLGTFSKMMRQLLDASMHEWVTVEKELSFLESYLGLEKMIRNDKFDYKIASSVSADVFIPPMILQPFLENAIIHGIKHKDETGFLTLTLEEQGKNMKAVIEDNGIGRKAASAYKQDGHESAALSIIEQRLKTLNKWEDLNLVYEDLEDASGKALGTRVTIQLPKQKTL